MIRRLRERRRPVLAGLAVLVLALVLSVGAVAYFTSTGSGTAQASVGSVNAPTGVTAKQSGANVTIDWGAATLSSGGGVQGYVVTRSDGTTVCGSPTPVTGLSCTDENVPSGNYTYTVTAEIGGFTASAASGSITVVTDTPPTDSLSLAAGASGAYLSDGTLYYKGNSPGSFELTDAVTDPSPAPASATFPAIGTAGWTHAAETVSSGSGSAPTISYTSSAFSWTANPSNPTDYTVSSENTLGTTSSGTALPFVSDITPPSGGALSVNGTAASGGGSTSTTASTSFSIDSRTDYSEAQSLSQSGLASSVLTVESESLTGSTCGAPGSGGPFTTPVTITGTTQPSGIVTGACYLYTLTGTDNVGNTASISTTVQASTTAPPTVGQEASYSGAIGNTTFGVGTSPAQPSTTTSGNLITDSDTTAPDGYTVTVETSGNPITTTEGGSVTVNSSGTFTYDPPAGFTGIDSFSFTVTDGHGTDSGTASITVAGYKIWYVNSSLGTNGNGTAASPFDTLSSAQSASGTGAYIFLFGSATSYSGGITLQSNQTLVGQSVGLVVDGETVNTGSGANPTITNSGGAGVTLASGVTVEGVNVSGTSGAGIAGAVGTDTIASSVTISNAGGPGLDITSGSSGTLSDAATINQTAKETTVDALAVSGATGGTVDQTGAITGAVDLTGSGSPSYTGATVNVSGALTASTGALEAFEATGGGTVNVTGATNTLATTTATALDVENTTIGGSGLTFESISAGSASAAPANGIYLIGTGTTGGLTVTGSGTTSGSGGTIYNKAETGLTADSSAILLGTPLNGPSTTPAPIGPVSLSDMTVEPTTSSPGEYGVYETNLSSFTLQHSTIEGPEQSDGVFLTGFGTSATSFDVASNTFTGGDGTPIEVRYPANTYSTTGPTTGSITGNTIGNQSMANSGATNGDGIEIQQQEGSGTMTVDVANNDVYQIEEGFGIDVSGNSGTIELTMTSNDVQLSSVYQSEQELGSDDAMTVQEVTGGKICANITTNTGHAVNTNEMDGSYDAVGLSAASDNPTAFQLQGYPTTDPSNSATDVQSYLNDANSLSGPSDPTDESIVGDNGTGTPDFVNATCSTVPAVAGAVRPSSARVTPATAGTATSAAPASQSTSATKQVKARHRQREQAEDHKHLERWEAQQKLTTKRTVHERARVAKLE